MQPAQYLRPWVGVRQCQMTLTSTRFWWYLPDGTSKTTILLGIVILQGYLKLDCLEKLSTLLIQAVVEDIVDLLSHNILGNFAPETLKYKNVSVQTKWEGFQKVQNFLEDYSQ